MEAIRCFRQMQSELAGQTSIHGEQARWELGEWSRKEYGQCLFEHAATDFQQRCTENLEKLGDTAMDSQSYNEATEHFSTILSLNPADHMDILVKRSKARASMNSWEDALSDADEVSFFAT